MPVDSGRKIFWTSKISTSSVFVELDTFENLFEAQKNLNLSRLAPVFSLFCDAKKEILFAIGEMKDI